MSSNHPGGQRVNGCNNPDYHDIGDCAGPTYSDGSVEAELVDAAMMGDGRAAVDDVARLLMAAWEEAEDAPVGVSYVATFTDMARAILASDWLAARTSAAVAQEQERIAAVRALAESVDVFYPSKFKFGAEANYVAGYNAARNDLRAALARGGDDL